jgi:hypothetical protein
MRTSALLAAMVGAAFCGVAVASADEVLHNFDVMRMAQAGIEDAVIVAKIVASDCQFDTAPRAMAQLRLGGVSDRVLGAMRVATTSPPTHVYTAVSLAQVGQSQRPGNFTLRLDGVDSAAGTYSLAIVAGNTQLVAKDRRLNEPVELFRMTNGQVPYDLMITRMTDGGISGYVWRYPPERDAAAGRDYTNHDYIDIRLGKAKKAHHYGDITLLLKDADVKRNRYTVDVMTGDELVEEKDRSVNEVVQFFTARGGWISYQLVITEVNKNEIVGYLAIPKSTIAAH